MVPFKTLVSTPPFIKNHLKDSTCQNRNNISTDKPEFRGSQIRAGASDGAENNETDCYNELPDVEETCALIDSVAEKTKTERTTIR